MAVEEKSKAYKFGSMIGKVFANIVMLTFIIVSAGIVAKPVVTLFLYGYHLANY